MPFKITLTDHNNNNTIIDLTDPDVASEITQQDPQDPTRRLFTIGRNSPGIDSKRCSRQQVQVRYCQETGRVEIIQLGANNSYLKRGGSGPEAMTKNHPYTIRDGSSFWLLENEFKFTVSIKKLISDSDDEKSENEVKSAVSSQRGSRSSSPVRNGTGSKGSGSSSNKPVCMFGTSCYRKNPAHHEEYAHPWLQKSSTDKPASKEKEKPKDEPKPKSRSSTSDAPITSSISSLAVSSLPRPTPVGGLSSLPRPTPANNTATKTPQQQVRPKPPATASTSNSTSTAKKSGGFFETDDMDIDHVGFGSRRSSGSGSASGSGSGGGAKGNEVHREREESPDFFETAVASRSQDKSNSQGSGSVKAKRVRADDDDVEIVSLPTKRKSSEEMDVDMALAPKRTSATTSRLAFSSIGTREGMISVDKAAECVAKVISEFLHSLNETNVELILADDDFKAVSAFQRQPELSAAKEFKIYQCDNIAKVNDQNLDCHIIAFETNWRLKPESTVHGRRVYDVGGADLARETKRLFPAPARVAETFVVPVPSSISLNSVNGITHVIHVVGPNMNPNRPDAIKDEATALTQLASAYKNVFGAFARIAGIGSRQAGGGAAAVRAGTGAGTPSARPAVNAFDRMMSSSRSTANTTPAGTSPTNSLRGFGPGPRGGSWDSVLIKYAEKPETFPKNVVQKYDDDIVVVHDAFPKAKKHYLVLPRERIDSIHDLRREHLPALDRIKAAADEIVARHGGHNFKLGFHAVPSMKQVHLHVISDDMVSPAMKNKRHWNSFTTKFFIPFEDIREMVERNGRVQINKDEYEELLKNPLKCHKCDEDMSNMPELKRHIENHD
ncbi:hypothetical protein HDU76_000518 [Blyttiomyces sp. JEL0837]|nr:hypothetical protein HDU76_000518 [Blyttiomyces sp. JEL0837]